KYLLRRALKQVKVQLKKKELGPCRGGLYEEWIGHLREDVLGLIGVACRSKCAWGSFKAELICEGFTRYEIATIYGAFVYVFLIDELRQQRRKWMINVLSRPRASCLLVTKLFKEDGALLLESDMHFWSPENTLASSGLC
ncbi:hypothetical protein HAX54_029630, partial [Datura stramonium]|nr:hypothetical protein [Datura stramonium]